MIVSRKTLFLTGTDTDIGKTLVSAWLCKHFDLHYHKPVQTGALYDMDSLYVKRFHPDVHIVAEQYVFDEPISPDLAALHAGVEIDDLIVPDIEPLLIEGAGGVMTPCTATDTFIRFAQKNMLPVLLVAPSRVGNINHCCLAAHALRTHNVDLLGVIVCGAYNSDEHVLAIERHARCKVLQQCQFKELAQDSIQPSSDLQIAMEKVF